MYHFAGLLHSVVSYVLGANRASTSRNKNPRNVLRERLFEASGVQHWRGGTRFMPTMCNMIKVLHTLSESLSVMHGCKVWESLGTVEGGPGRCSEAARMLIDMPARPLSEVPSTTDALAGDSTSAGASELGSEVPPAARETVKFHHDKRSPTLGLGFSKIHRMAMQEWASRVFQTFTRYNLWLSNAEVEWVLQYISSSGSQVPLSGLEGQDTDGDKGASQGCTTLHSSEEAGPAAGGPMDCSQSQLELEHEKPRKVRTVLSWLCVE